MDIKANALKHWRSQLLPELLCLEVPEWGDEEEGPAKLYFRNVFTGEDRIRIAKAADERGDKGALMEVLIVAARKADGTKLFSATDRTEMLTAYDFSVVERVANQILRDMMRPPSLEEAAGN